MAAAAELVIITPAEISAFLDGELPPEERSDVAACVRDDDRAACLLSAWQWQLGLLWVAFGRIIDEPPPPRLRLGAPV
jgi:anti-sigma factor RsiW